VLRLLVDGLEGARLRLGLGREDAGGCSESAVVATWVHGGPRPVRLYNAAELVLVAGHIDVGAGTCTRVGAAGTGRLWTQEPRRSSESTRVLSGVRSW